ncbi:hypothetical protein AB0J25_23450 [Streptomyces sp. NPDC049910]|uniref:hypothetical protein n=1 Tax=Streptomyces sp. NPDC049910 TaxID=3155278 RepID=UPI0034271F6B
MAVPAPDLDEDSFSALVATQLLGEDGSFTREFQDFVDMASNVLVIDQLTLAEPWDDAQLAAAVVASAIDRLTDNYFAVVLPRAAIPSHKGNGLLAEAGAMLAAEPFTDELQVIDTALAAPEEAAHRVRLRLASRARYGHLDEDADWDDEEEFEVLAPRTAAVLRQALQDLSQQAWQEVAALGDEPLRRGAGGLFGASRRSPLAQGNDWHRQMARAFVDLAADPATDPGGFEPCCTGEEVALHLGLTRAAELVRDRPRLVNETLTGIPERPGDFDWDACSDVPLQDHDVLMLVDPSLDGVEVSGSEVNQALGMVNLASLDWFTSFAPEGARDPDRGYQHP